jgi:predicted dehydrogenase
MKEASCNCPSTCGATWPGMVALTVPSAWFGSQPPAELVPWGFAEQVATLPPLPAKRLATASELEAFAQAVRGVRAYPVTTNEMLANVASLEAIMKSVQARAPVAVAQP